MIFSKSQLLTTMKAAFRAIGLDVGFANATMNEENTLRRLFRGQRVQFVLDVGANTGQFGSLVRKCGFLGPIVSFEPLAAANRKLVARAAHDPQWTIADRAAVGAAPSTGVINVAFNSTSSSLLGMNVRHLRAAPNSRLLHTEEVSVIPLDDCLDRYVAADSGGFLKVDAQGYELEVFRGADKCLSRRIDVIQTELSLVELYEHQPLMLEICEALKQYNFQLRHIIPGLKDPIDHSLLQFDGIFLKN